MTEPRQLKLPITIEGIGDQTRIVDNDGDILAVADWDGLAVGEGGINDLLLEICERANGETKP